MKKTILALALALGMFSGNGQEINFGAKAGLNLASFTGDETGDDLKNRTGFHIGAVAEFSLSEKFSLQSELLYSTQGSKFEFIQSGVNFSFDNKSTIILDYITLPIMAKYYVAKGLSVEAGPQIGFLLSAEEEIEFNQTIDGQTDSGFEERDIKDLISNVDFGVNFGLGYKLENGLNFVARYNLGLTNIYDFEGSNNFKRQNSVFQFSVGYSF